MSGTNLLGIPQANRWKRFNMVPSATTTAPAKSAIPTGDIASYRRVGDSMEITWNYRHVGTDPAGVQGSGTYLYPIPDQYQANNDILGFSFYNANLALSPGQPSVGIASISDEGGDAVSGIVYISRNGKNMIITVPVSSSDTGLSNQGSTNLSFSLGSLAISLKAMIPIAGWDNI